MGGQTTQNNGKGHGPIFISDQKETPGSWGGPRRLSAHLQGRDLLPQRAALLLHRRLKTPRGAGAANRFVCLFD